jgi:hypothetical protein
MKQTRTVKEIKMFKKVKDEHRPQTMRGTSSKARERKREYLIT